MVKSAFCVAGASPLGYLSTTIRYPYANEATEMSIESAGVEQGYPGAGWTAVMANGVEDGVDGWTDGGGGQATQRDPTKERHRENLQEAS